MNLAHLRNRHQQALQSVFPPQPRVYTHLTRGGGFLYALTPGGEVLFTQEDLNRAGQQDCTASDGISVLDNAPEGGHVCVQRLTQEGDGRLCAWGTTLVVRMVAGRSVGRLTRTGLRERHWGFLRQKGGTFRSWKTLTDHPGACPPDITLESYEALVTRARTQGRAALITEEEGNWRGGTWPSGAEIQYLPQKETPAETAQPADPGVPADDFPF